jgi:hypothetical protein
MTAEDGTVQQLKAFGTRSDLVVVGRLKREMRNDVGVAARFPNTTLPSNFANVHVYGYSLHVHGKLTPASFVEESQLLLWGSDAKRIKCAAQDLQYNNLRSQQESVSADRRKI